MAYPMGRKKRAAKADGSADAKRGKTTLRRAAEAERKTAELMSTVSVYGKKLKRLRKLAHGNQRRDDAYFLQNLYAMLDAVQGMLPIAEEAYRSYKNDRAIHPVTHLVGHQLELMNIIRNLQGTGHVTEQIVAWMKTAMSNLLQIYLDETAIVRAQVLDLVPKPQRREAAAALQKYVEGHAKASRDTFLALQQQVTDFLQVSPGRGGSGKGR